MFIEIETEAFALAVMTGAAEQTLQEETAMKQKTKTEMGRRDFLRALGAGAGLAATGGGAACDRRSAAESDNDEKKARYNGRPTT